MNFINRELLLDSPTGAYYSGQNVSGRFLFDLTSSKHVRGIQLTVKGFCSVHWTEDRTRTEDGREIHYTITHESYEEYITLTMYLLGSQNGNHILNPGKHDFPFNFQLPNACPSSFEGSRGHVRYELRAGIYLHDGYEETYRGFEVHPQLDLNQIDCKMPMEFDFEQTYCCCCFSSGYSQTLVKMPVRGFCPGQTIPLDITCRNPSSVDISAIRFEIVKQVKYRATREPDEEVERKNLHESVKGPIPSHTDKHWTVEIPLTSVEVCNLDTCSFIDLSYELRVTVEPDGCHSNDTQSCEIFIGTEPLVSQSDKLPTTDQVAIVPQNQPTVNAPYPQMGMNQPMLTHSNNSPYPSNPNLYPQNTPYPAPQPNLAPYPVSQPYPPQPMVSPYAQPPNPPYGPPNASPYPLTQPGQTPYPVNNMPYPGNPYPQRSPLLKTGTVGFVTDSKDPSAMPLLQTGSMPYPPQPSIPFMGASAPSSAPDTPPEISAELNVNNSPFNPAFMDKDKDKKEQSKPE